MTKPKTTASKEEIRELAEALVVFQKLPQQDRIAVTYYIKGRLDAAAGDLEIPAVPQTAPATYA